MKYEYKKTIVFKKTKLKILKELDKHKSLSPSPQITVLLVVGMSTLKPGPQSPGCGQVPVCGLLGTGQHSGG